MTHTRIAILYAGLGIGCLAMLGIVGGQDGPFSTKEKKPKPDKPEKFEKGDKGDKGFSPEDKAVLKFAEKAAKPPETERDKWLKELEKAFPGRVSPGLSDADFLQWFDLASGGAPNWPPGAGPKSLRELAERARERLNLGPQDEIRRDEFLRYARMSLLPGQSPPWKADKTLNDIDKLFRELDRDGSGALERDEWTERLAEAARRVDVNRDGRIDRGEYLAYIQGRVATTVERGPEPPLRPERNAPNAAAPSAAPAPVAAIRAGHLPKGVPAWFAEADISRDGQLELWEWRRAQRPIEEFVRLDLDRDGLLHPEEYLRALRQPAAETATENNPDTEDAWAEPPPVIPRNNSKK